MMYCFAVGAFITLFVFGVAAAGAAGVAMMPNQAYRVGIWWLLQLVMNFHWFDRNQSGAPLTVRFLRERERVRERERG
jgi:hypothetical protein